MGWEGKCVLVRPLHPSCSVSGHKSHLVGGAARRRFLPRGVAHSPEIPSFLIGLVPSRSPPEGNLRVHDALCAALSRRIRFEQACQSLGSCIICCGRVGHTGTAQWNGSFGPLIKNASPCSGAGPSASARAPSSASPSSTITNCHISVSMG